MERVDDGSEIHRTDDQDIDIAALCLGCTCNRTEDKCHLDAVSDRLKGLCNNICQPRRLA